MEEAVNTAEKEPLITPQTFYTPQKKGLILPEKTAPVMSLIPAEKELLIPPENEALFTPEKEVLITPEKEALSNDSCDAEIDEPEAQIDKTLKHCFLQAVTTRLLDRDFPMLGVTLYEKHMCMCRLIDSTCSVQDSSF